MRLLVWSSQASFVWCFILRLRAGNAALRSHCNYNGMADSRHCCWLRWRHGCTGVCAIGAAVGLDRWMRHKRGVCLRGARSGAGESQAASLEFGGARRLSSMRCRRSFSVLADRLGAGRIRSAACSPHGDQPDRGAGEGASKFGSPQHLRHAFIWYIRAGAGQRWSAAGRRLQMVLCTPPRSRFFALLAF